MQILSTCGNNFKLKFNNQSLAVGSLIASIKNEDTGVLAQVVSIDNSVASLKILYSVKSGVLLPWEANLPSFEDKIVVLDDENFISAINCKNVVNPVNIGRLSSCISSEVNISANDLELPTLILSDSAKQIEDFTVSIASEIAKNNAKIAILDFKGQYLHLKAPKVKAGSHFKLPLNVKNLNKLYDKVTECVSDSAKVAIQDIFIQIENYIDTCEGGFIPLNSFKDVVDNQYKETRTPELALLKNQLFKYQKDGIFANTKQEFEVLYRAFTKSNLVVIDFSNVSADWQSDFIDVLVTNNIQKYKQKYFLTFEANENNLKPSIIEKIYNTGFKSGLKTIIFSKYNGCNVQALYSYASNLCLFKPLFEHNITDLKQKIKSLAGNQVLLTGVITNKIDTIVNLENKFESTNINVFDAVEKAEATISLDYSSVVPETDLNQDSIAEIPVEPVTIEESAVPFEQDEVLQQEEYQLDETASLEQEPIQVVEEELTQPEELQVEESPVLTQEAVEIDSYDGDEAEELATVEVTDEAGDEFDSILDDALGFDDELTDNIDLHNEEVANFEAEVQQIEAEVKSTSDNIDIDDLDFDDDFDIAEDDINSEEVKPEKELEDYSSQDMSDVYDDVASLYEEPKKEENYYASSGEFDFNEGLDDMDEDDDDEEEETIQPPTTDLPVYSASDDEDEEEFSFVEGDTVKHQKYGQGVINKIIGYGDKKLCSIQFEGVGRRLLDPKLAVIEKV